jgi:hypothetical protein
MPFSKKPSTPNPMLLVNITHSTSRALTRTAPRIARITAAGLFIGLSWTVGSAQIVLNPSAMTAGGGVSTSARYRVQTSSGQPAAGSSHAGVFTLTGGYWSGAAAIQTPDAPRLDIRRDPSGAGLIVAWTGDAGDWVLQETTRLDAVTPWTDVRSAAHNTELEVQVSVATTAGIRFYRLRPKAETNR